MKKVLVSLAVGAALCAVGVCEADDYGPDILTGGTPSTDSPDSGNPASNGCDDTTGTRWVALAGLGLPHWWKYDLGTGDGSPDILTGGTASTDSPDSGNPASNGCDNTTGTRWVALGGSGLPHWWKYDLGSGVTKIVRELRMYQATYNEATIKDFTLQGSNNDSDWTVLYTGQRPDTIDSWNEFVFDNSTAYRYYKINVTTNWGAHPWTGCHEMEMLEEPGAPVVKTVRKLRLIHADAGGTRAFTLAGSNNDSSWTTIYTGERADNANWQEFTFLNPAAYRYYKITITTNWGGHQWAGLHEIEMMGFANNPPTAFSLTAPPNLTSTNGNTPTFSWGTSTDPESQSITYTMKLSTTAGFTEPVYRTVSGLIATSYTPPTGQEIADGSYYWKAIASDGVLQTESTQSWQLAVDTQKPVAPVIAYVGSNSQTGKIIEIRGTGESATTLTFYDKNNNTIAGSTHWDGGNFTFIPTTPLDPGSSVYVESQDGATNTSQSKTRVIIFESYADIFKADDVHHGTGLGTSMRMEKDTSYEFDLAVNDGVAVTVKAWMMYNSEYDGSGANPPQITLSGMGITTCNTAAMTAPASYTPGTWEQLTVSGTPNAKGVVTLKVETFSTAEGAKLWVDDILVSQ